MNIFLKALCSCHYNKTDWILSHYFPQQWNNFSVSLCCCCFFNISTRNWTSILLKVIKPKIHIQVYTTSLLVFCSNVPTTPCFAELMLNWLLNLSRNNSLRHSVICYTYALIPDVSGIGALKLWIQGNLDSFVSVACLFHWPSFQAFCHRQVLRQVLHLYSKD